MRRFKSFLPQVRCTLSIAQPWILGAMVLHAAGCSPTSEGDLNTQGFDVEVSVSTGCRPEPTQVAVFTDPNFGGKCSLLDPGTYARSGATGFGVANDAISSVIVGSKVIVTLFQHPNYTGLSR